MDKLKPIIAGMMKYHFWILLGIVVVVALFTWNSAVGRLDTEFSANKTKIDMQFSKVDGMSGSKIELASGEARFANENWKDETIQEAKLVREKVKKAWQDVYNEQRASRVWPVITNQQRGPGFNFGASIESSPPDTPLPVDLIEPYKEALAQQVAGLPALVSAAKIPEFDPKARRAAAAADPMAAMMNDTGGVRWEAANYHQIQSQLTPDPKTELTTGWVKEAQEDIWAYQLILKAIEKSNGESGVRDEYNLPINRIEYIDLGILVSQDLDTGSAVDSIPDPVGLTSREGTPSFEQPMDEGEKEDAAKTPEKKEYGRYTTGKRSPVGFNSLPVRLGLEMNLSKLPVLLLELADADLTTEIVDIYIVDHRGAGREGVARVNRNNPMNEFGGGGARERLPVEGITVAKNPQVEILALIHFAEQPNDLALMSPEELKASAEKAAADKKAAEKAAKDKKKK